jgi:hypothetical protein
LNIGLQSYVCNTCNEIPGKMLPDRMVSFDIYVVELLDWILFFMSSIYTQIKLLSNREETL